MNDKPGMIHVSDPDYATVEFQLNHFPAPMVWNGMDRTLSWVNLPDPPVEGMEKWDALLPELRRLILREVRTHVPSDEAVEKGLKLHFMAYDGIPLSSLHLRPLRELLPWQVIAKEKLTITSMRILYTPERWLPEGSLW